MFDNCTGSWMLFVPCVESIEVCEVETCEQVSAEIDMYRIGYSDTLCTIRPNFRHPTTIQRSDLFECSWPGLFDYFYAAEVTGSVWDRCEAG